MWIKRIHMSDENPEVTRYARMLLKHANISDQLPTPVDDIVTCANLVVSQDITLSEKHTDFFTRSLGILKSALEKVIGMVDLREDIIYLDTTLLPQKRTFIKLHETGHKVLPWQRQTYLYLDDETTLAPDVHEHFEREANCFAADVLFQIDRFDQDAHDLPLAIKSPLTLSKRYGASAHAAIRRYVERSKHACAVLIIERLPELGTEGPLLRIKKVIQSTKFVHKFEQVKWPVLINMDWPFTELILRRCRFFEDGEIVLNDRDNNPIRCHFHIFDNSYNVFVFIYPFTEQVRHSKKIIVVR